METADRVETTIREKIAFLAGMRGVGHRRQDLTSSPVRFFAVYSYLIVYRPETRPLQVAAILHGNRRRPGMQDARGRLPPRLIKRL